LLAFLSAPSDGHGFRTSSGSSAIFAAIPPRFITVRVRDETVCNSLMPAMLLRRPLCALDANKTSNRERAKRNPF
jgi:hypothetical protein